jgi:Xaa-Pro aminopeptidase
MPGTGSRPAVDLDLDRMRRERLARLRAHMAARGVDALALRCTANLEYAGAAAPCIVTATGDTQPYEALRDLVASGARVAADDLTAELWDVEVSDAADVVDAARLRKTRDEIECIRRAQRINEDAMVDVEAAASRRGIHQDELTALFLDRVGALGATNVVEPIWQVADPDAPLLFPLVGQDRTLAPGDVVVVDTGISYCGYSSDYGRTWGAAPEHFARWRAVTDAVLEAVVPGATGLDLVRAAGEWYGRRPWLDHLYLAHGTGTSPAEMPLVGTDLGDDFDAGTVLEPGMVLVLEPVIWEPGRGGYRAEETVVVTESGYEMLSERVERCA